MRRGLFRSVETKHVHEIATGCDVLTMSIDVGCVGRSPVDFGAGPLHETPRTTGQRTREAIRFIELGKYSRAWESRYNFVIKFLRNFERLGIERTSRWSWPRCH